MDRRGNNMKLKMIKECLMCGTEFTPNAKGQLYCSNRCYDMHYSMKELYHHTERLGEPRHLNCANCGKDVYTRHKHTRFCCYECKLEYSKKKKMKTYTCKVCGKDFSGIHRSVYCSEDCKLKMKNKRQRDAYYNGGKEKQAEYRRKNVDRVREYRIKYFENNRERLNKLSNKSHRRAAIRKRSERIEKEQEKLLKTANFRAITDKDTAERWKALHIIRETTSVFHCLDCGRKFVLTKSDGGIAHILGDRLKYGKGNPCPFCGSSPVNLHRFNSAETEIAERYPNFTERNIRPDWMDGKELDLYDPERKIAIEFNGIVWHSTKHKKETDAHKVKADLCEKAGVQLIQIWETEWFQKKECVLDKLDAIMHLNMTKVAARKLKARIMETKEERAMVSSFLDENHIQGHAGCQWAVALMDGENIAAVCTFKYGTGYANAGSGKKAGYYWELNRYATRLHTSVQGGISKCISAFRKSHPDVKSIVSFADRRWTCPTRSAYASSGFVEEGRAAPNYMYTDLKPYSPLRNKQYMRKSSIESRAKADPEGPEAKVFSWDKTETVMSEELGWYRLYDAGKIKYRMTL